MENLMNLEAIQLELEDEMVSKGAARYAKEIEEGGLSTSKVGNDLIKRARRLTAEHIENLKAPKGRGRPKAGLAAIRSVDSWALADIALRRVFDSAAKEETVTKTAKSIAKAVEWHVKDAGLCAASRAIWEKQQQRLKRTPSPEFRRKSIDGSVRGLRDWAETEAPDLYTKLLDARAPDWEIKEQLRVGALLIGAVAEATDLIGTKEVTAGKGKTKAIVYFPELVEARLQKDHAYHALTRPVHLPMVVPPSDWGRDEDGAVTGGYIDNRKAGINFIKTKARDLDTDRVDMSDAYDAVNLIQHTAWRVNRTVLDVMNQIWDTGSQIADVPPRRHEDAMRRLPDIPSKFADMTPEQRKASKDPVYQAWLSRRRETHEYNGTVKTTIKTFGDLMSVANRFVQYDAFYHPHKLDWRQRAYPISVFLSPQGDQFNRGLIEFAEGKRMGDSENSGSWLAIHGANCYGVDKVSFEERIKWVETFTASILESAFDPFGTAFWQQADKPWPFLAFCMEWAGYLIAGDDFVTHLPVALDGSNSGLQHLSAMLRDERGAKVTCVQPGPKPEDVYQMVADAVEAEIQSRRNALEHEDHQWNDIWAGKVTRKIVKQPTMTYTYSATIVGMTNQIAAALRDANSKAEGRTYLSYTDKNQTDLDAAKYLAVLVRTAIESRMEKAAEAMKFMQALVRTYSKTGLPVRWTTPVGVPIVQYYPTSTSERIDVFINATRHNLRVNIDAPDKLNKKRAASGVAPNFVHSMDSTHLLWTVLYCSDVHQLDSFSMIHDSFGTHATACDELASATREMFIALYDEDRLRDLRNEVAGLLETVGPDLIEELPDVPSFGTFNIESVRESDYFFA